MSRFSALLLVPVAALFLNWTVCAEGHHGGGAEEHGGEKKEEIVIPDNFADAVGVIEKKRDEIAKLIEDGKLEKLHEVGEVIKKVAESLAKLASKEGSGVAKADLKAINLAAKDLASKYGPLDEAGDNGKKEDAKKVLDEMTPLIETLKKFVKKK